MRYLGPTRFARLNEAVAVVFLFAGLFVFFGLISYHPFDPSLNTASAPPQPANLTGRMGAYFADFFLQLLGIGAYAIPVLILMLGWKWIRSAEIDAPTIKLSGGAMLVCSTCALLGMLGNWKPIAGMIPAGGMIGSLLADALIGSMNITGAILAAAACWIVSVYLVSAFEMKHLLRWLRGPAQWIANLAHKLAAWREERLRRARLKAEARALKRSLNAERKANAEKAARAGKEPQPEVPAAETHGPPILDPLEPAKPRASRTPRENPPPEIDDIPIRTLEPMSPPFEPAT